jgi:glutamate/tyrosine decarboxylase-like PLP-dependent enzyme
VDLRYWLDRAVGAVEEWAAAYGPYEPHPALSVPDQEFAAAFAALAGRLHDNYPFFHPRYAGQMLKPPHPAAVAGYVAAMLINPNNHALDGGPATAQMEKEVVADLAAMFRLPTHLGHLTSSGTIANLEALFVARETHPDLGVAYSAEAHYTHGRMCQLLRMPGYVVPTDSRGRMDLSACADLLRAGRVGTVVLTAGTTGLGAVDAIQDALELKERYGVRLHVDAAYGGFFTLIAGGGRQERFDPRGWVPAAPWRAIAHCDSVVIDPHKHGLQPYGCGCVLFADPGVGRFYAHDSPYTYFTSEALHLGEISLECSRAGASAAALWVTLQVLPLTPDGLGKVLAATRRAALAFADLVDGSDALALYQQPELDIVTYFPRRGALADIDAAAARMLADGMAAGDPVFLSTLRVTGAGFSARGHHLRGQGDARILRSVLMKPEQESYAEELFARIERLANPG